MRLAENERSEVRSASRIIPRAKLSRAIIWKLLGIIAFLWKKLN